MNEFIQEDRYILGVILIGLIGLSIVFISNAYAGIPSPVPGLGEEAPIDTGFSGEILLPQEVYYELSELELREVSFQYIRLLSVKSL